ncbi:hypothetical protein JZO70_08125 [Enterococcus sp. 669A]|uniref:SpaA-like prealbumin fold domain-containing protein n=1 Tax=Candidatus Enterococcus moelleringii TaxID=2815325 RepID=A0ABS3L946_9ENTE|nr:SpaA isopeptide-forming pilin-related protein [Enterococcus sp. 669A]MBO1306125.1 hypothetical protein [Enterococcus sp. 669A]
MRRKIKLKQIVAILLPIVFILGIVHAISSMDSLRADDTSSQLTVRQGDEDVTGKDVSILEPSVLLELTAKENQLFRLVESNNVGLSSSNEEENNLPVREVLSSQFDLEQEKAALEEKADKKTEPKSELIIVRNFETGEATTYLKLLKDDAKKVYITRETEENTEVTLENVVLETKQKVMTFTLPEVQEPEPEPEQTEPEQTEEEPEVEAPEEVEEPQAPEITGEESIEELVEREYSEAESFKPIALPFEEGQKKKQSRASSPINVTGARMQVRTGTASFDANSNPGNDADATNEWVRTFDSNIYLLTFSLEGSDPGVTYKDIKYRIDMDLPNAYGFDSSNKTRNNFGIIAENSGNLRTEPDGTKTENGYVESSINSNGQILLPIFVNVFGAQHNTLIQPKMKITIISALNENTGSVETINQVYDENNLSALKVPDARVSAKANINTSLVKGQQKPFGSTISGGGWNASTRNNWQVAGLGVGIKLKELSGRAAGDFRGSTFPVGDIQFTLGTTKTTYQIGNGTPSNVTIGNNSTSTTQAYPVKIIAGTWGSLDSTASNWDWYSHKSGTRTLNIDSAILSKGIPYGKGIQIHSSEPTTNDLSKIGVYDTGTVTVPTDTIVKVSDYEPVWNPYTYSMASADVGKNNKYFASTSLLVEWSNLYFANRPETAKTYEATIEITNIKYENQSHAGEGKTTLSISADPGTISQHVLWTYPYNPVTKQQGNSLGSVNSQWDGRGDAKVAKGYEFTASVRYSDMNRMLTSKVVAYGRWNANSIAYDSTRNMEVVSDYPDLYTFYYGVKKSGTVPQNTYLTETAIEGQYTWYSDVNTALAGGKIISAVKAVGGRYAGNFGLQVPVKAIGPINDYRDSSGNPNIILMNTFTYGLNGQVRYARPNVGNYYAPSVFNTSGVKTGGHYARNAAGQDIGQAGYQASHGDTLWINGVGITTTTEPGKSIYKTDESVSWKVSGNVTGGNANHTVRLTTTIPKGLEYTTGTAKDGKGNSISPQSTKKNADGSTTIVWLIDNINPSKGDIPEVNFDTASVMKDLTFNDSAVSEVTVHTEGEIWIKGSPNEKDTSKIQVRESTGKVQLYQMQKISLTKEAVPELIEVGKNDPANTSLSTDIKYKIKIRNDSSDKIVNAKILDALPYNGDSFGTSFNGSYTVAGIKITKGTGTINYTDATLTNIENTNPNSIPTSSPLWPVYTQGSGSTAIKNAKAFLITARELAVGDELEFEITISPTGQKAGDVYRNRASFNSTLYLPVNSNIVETKVYGRDLTGYVWYDDDYDGLIGNKKDGTPEDPASNIEVKLYRTSKEKPSYKDQVVKESLTGEKFIDGSGNSLVKTGPDGKYKFENLPEGEYSVEFSLYDLVIIRKVMIVTKQLVGSDATKNSKADPDLFITPWYDQPKLTDLPAACKPGQSVSHVTDVNAGLVRVSKIRLFKYVEGSAVDQNNDGQLSEQEIENTATPLRNAEFDIYKGNSTDPADKIGSAKTDGTGWLEFTQGFAPGDYTIVETKAPPGYELIKEPIKVTVPQYNYILKVYVSDTGETLLPFTGSNEPMQIVLIVSGSLMLLGMIGVIHHFHPIKLRKVRKGRVR